MEQKNNKYAHYTAEELRKELEEFNREKEKVRQLIGTIGGNSYSKRDFIINIVFFIVVISLFLLEFFVQILPKMLSLEIGVMLISIKIIWMIHSQDKVNHFQFWILNSIEYRINNISKDIAKLKEEITSPKE